MDEEAGQYLEKQHFIEEIGLFFEQGGLPRMAGRVLGWLLIANPPHQSFNNLQEALSASKGSISTSTQLLLQIGLIERFSLPAHRRDYYRIRPDVWSQIIQKRLFWLTTLRQLAERGLCLMNGEDALARQRLEEMRDVYTFFEQEMPGLIERWETRKKQRNES